MKRPFAVLCILLAALSVAGYVTGGSERDRPLRETAELLQREAGSGGEVTLAGTVKKCSAASSGVRLSVDHLTIQRKDNSEQALFPRLNVMITTEHTELLPGDAITVSGELSFPDPDSNPGQFDAQSYYHAQNTLCFLSRAEIHVLRQGGMSLARALCLVRRRLGTVYDAIFGEHQAEVMGAICLGERALLEQKWKQLYQEGGISHILAISGLHITLVGMCLYRLLRKLKAPFGVSCAVSGGIVILYVWMVGATVSAVRALIMFGFWLGAQLCGRKYDMRTAIAAAAMLLLSADARYLTQSSFLLSFGAVLSIALLLPCLRRITDAMDQGRGKISMRRGRTARMRAAGFGAMRNFGKALLQGFGIWLGMLPLTLYFFYQAVTWSVLINLAVVPLMSLLMLYGLLAGVVGLLSIPFGCFFAAPAYYLLDLFEFLCRLKEGLPLPLWVAGRPALWRIALYYGILLAVGFVSCQLPKREKSFARGKRKTDPVPGQCLLWVMCSALCIGLMCQRPQKTLEVTCLDVGQGDAALLRLPDGVSCLVDGGSSSESKLWQYRIGQAVKYYGVSALDYIFLSHADGDHISGIKEYLEEYDPGFAGENVHGVTLRNLVLPPTADPEDFAKLRELAQEKGIRVLRMEAGAAIGTAQKLNDADTQSILGNTDVVQADAGQKAGWSIRCLAPDEESLTGDSNEDSMVLMLQYGEFRMLFTGDLEGTAEQSLAASGANLSADVLKVGHHGSKNASSEAFLEQVSPQVAVISCGANNSYGHPAQETMERLRDAGCRILQTPQSGAVTIESDGETYTVEPYRTAE